MMFAVSPPPLRAKRCTFSPSGVVPKCSPSIAPLTREASDTEAADAHIFGVEIIVDALVTAFAAEPGFLDAAERRLDRCDQPLVDADHAVFQAFHDAHRPPEIAGVEVARQP